MSQKLFSKVLNKPQNFITFQNTIKKSTLSFISTTTIIRKYNTEGTINKKIVGLDFLELTGKKHRDYEFKSEQVGFITRNLNLTTFKSPLTLSLEDNSDEQSQIEEEGASIKIISDHMRKHAKPSTDEEFGYYLAGLIEAESIIKGDQLEIILNEKDASLAFFIKKRVGFGSVPKREGKPIRYVLKHPEGLKTILNLINGKFLTTNKVDQLLKNNYDQKFGVSILPPSNFDITENHFLAGFCDATAHFDIKIPKSADSHLIKLHFCIETKSLQKEDPIILKRVKSKFGGSIQLDEIKGVYHYNNYNTTSFNRIYKIISYFDRFHLNAARFNDFFKFRKTYRIIQRNEHFGQRGLTKIMATKNSLKFRLTEVESLNE